jgi:hypothetical protein
MHRFLARKLSHDGDRFFEDKYGTRSQLTRMSVHFSPSFRTCAPLAGPGVYCLRSVIFFR